MFNKPSWNNKREGFLRPPDQEQEERNTDKEKRRSRRKETNVRRTLQTRALRPGCIYCQRNTKTNRIDTAEAKREI